MSKWKRIQNTARRKSIAHQARRFCINFIINISSYNNWTQNILRIHFNEYAYAVWCGAFQLHMLFIQIWPWYRMDVTNSLLFNCILGIHKIINVKFHTISIITLHVNTSAEKLSGKRYSVCSWLHVFLLLLSNGNIAFLMLNFMCILHFMYYWFRTTCRK